MDIGSETQASFRKRMEAIQVPEGFTANMVEEDDYRYDAKSNKSVPIKVLAFVLEKKDDTKIKFDQSGCGHTSFKVGDDDWRTFDRRGVEDSFYHIDMSYFPKGEKRPAPKHPDLNKLVAEQLKRIEERREYYRTAVPVPGLPGGFTVAADGVENLKKALNKHGHITFTPAGFGTGYCITKRPQRGLRYGESRAKAELETFLGQSPLYVSTMDCD